MIDGRVVSLAGDQIRIASPQLDVNISARHQAPLSIGQDVWFALRPEKIQLHREKPDQGTNHARGMVEDVIYLGDMSTYKITLDSGKSILATKPNIARLDENNITWDEMVYISWDADAGIVLTS